MSIPARIGPYRVTRLLGEGGMGAVYEAIDDSIERRVAVKVLLPHAAKNQTLVSRFFNEARAANRINHPSTVQIFEHKQLADGTAYLVMELLSGESLAARLRRAKPLPLVTVADLGWQVATALDAAHKAGIVHRDLKPDNLMLVADPVAPRGERVKVLDFGIAKLVEGVSNPTKSNVIMGTPTYMSPEQCQGAGRVDARSDLYSLGVILFELLAGRPPFVGEGPGEVIGMHLFAEPPDLATVAPQAPPRFTQLVNRLLRKDRNQRPSLDETIATLAALRDDRASAPTLVEQPVPTPRPRRFRVVFPALAAIGVCAAASFSAWHYSRAARQTVPPLEREAERPNAPIAAAAPETRVAPQPLPTVKPPETAAQLSKISPPSEPKSAASKQPDEKPNSVRPRPPAPNPPTRSPGSTAKRTTEPDLNAALLEAMTAEPKAADVMPPEQMRPGTKSVPGGDGQLPTPTLPAAPSSLPVPQPRRTPINPFAKEGQDVSKRPSLPR